MEFCSELALGMTWTSKPTEKVTSGVFVFNAALVLVPDVKVQTRSPKMHPRVQMRKMDHWQIGSVSKISPRQPKRSAALALVELDWSRLSSPILSVTADLVAAADLSAAPRLFAVVLLVEAANGSGDPPQVLEARRKSALLPLEKAVYRSLFSAVQNLVQAERAVHHHLELLRTSPSALWMPFPEPVAFQRSLFCNYLLSLFSHART